ncbi:hypothetical protein [Inhella gelatinilytica]|uniref:Tfp pilus assembly protein PilX n=1 Tax=Inhella gelatinilytica TaxID=2795030 RepID=A0A931IWR8_9BURK|nr:hypothetical protein [Inhella gelatinilytica]MBH9552986.1 hypothetical protein [Inhella gelatinilytica]
MTPQTARSQRGLATLVSVLALLLGAALMSVYAQRHEVLAQRMVQLDLEWVRAQTAAENGLRTLHQLLNRESGWPGCSPSGLSARELWLDPTANGAWSLKLTDAEAVALHCRLGTQGSWQCACPGQPESGEATDPGADHAATVQLRLSPSSQGLRLRAQACTRVDTVCAASVPAADVGLVASARISEQVRWVSALANTPGVALSIQGRLSTHAGVRIESATAIGPWIRVGAPWESAAQNLIAPPGIPADTLVQLDSSTAPQDAQDFLMPWLGVSPAEFPSLLQLQPLRCADDCADALVQRVAQGERLIWVDGPLTIGRPVTLGRPDRPILVVASGAVTVGAPLVHHGLLVAAAGGQWVGGGELHGGLLSAGDWVFAGPTQVVATPQHLTSLARHVGRWVRFPGGREST